MILVRTRCTGTFTGTRTVWRILAMIVTNANRLGASPNGRPTNRGIARPVRCEAACYGAGQTDVWFDVILRPHVRIQVYSTVPYLVRY
jgi:hypothetical protein